MRGERSGIAAQNFGNCLQYGVGIEQDVVVPEPKDKKALFVKPLVPPEVMLAFGMLSAVSFHDKARPETDEIDYVVPYLLLPLEFRACQTACPQARP